MANESDAINFTLRTARLGDRAQIEQLIIDSARGLSREDYTNEQIEAAITAVFGVDTDLIYDGTYFVAEHAGTLIGCGGWSKRKTLFGSDRYAQRETGMLDPRQEPAKIRAFFVHPNWARQGVGRALLHICEAEAKANGFHTLELMATLPGVKLYRALGYIGSDRVIYKIGDSIDIEFVPMRKTLM